MALPTSWSYWRGTGRCAVEVVAVVDPRKRYSSPGATPSHRPKPHSPTCRCSQGAALHPVASAQSSNVPVTNTDDSAAPRRETSSRPVRIAPPIPGRGERGDDAHVPTIAAWPPRRRRRRRPARSGSIGQRILGIVRRDRTEIHESTTTILRSSRLAPRRPDRRVAPVIIDSVDSGARSSRISRAGDTGPSVGVRRRARRAGRRGCGQALSSPPRRRPPSRLGSWTRRSRRWARPPSAWMRRADAAVGAGHRRLGLIGTRFVVTSLPGPVSRRPVSRSARDRQTSRRPSTRSTSASSSRASSATRAASAWWTSSRRCATATGSTASSSAAPELALILTEPAYAGVPILDTAKIHAAAAVDWLLGGP